MGDDLTRRAVIAAHDAECNRQCGEDAATYRRLTTVEQAIVELWQADVERALELASKNGQAAAESHARAVDAEADLAALHTLLTHPAAAELLDHHRYLRSGVHGSCSCRGDYGPGHETPEQWVEHLLEAGRLEHGIGGGE